MSDTEKIEKIVELIKNLSLLEAFELVKNLEKTFGIDASSYARAAAPVAVAGGGAAAAPAQEEKTEFDVIILDAGDKKINVIKEIGVLQIKEASRVISSYSLSGKVSKIS